MVAANRKLDMLGGLFVTPADLGSSVIIFPGEIRFDCRICAYLSSNAMVSCFSASHLLALSWIAALTIDTRPDGQDCSASRSNAHPPKVARRATNGYVSLSQRIDCCNADSFPLPDVGNPEGLPAAAASGDGDGFDPGVGILASVEDRTCSRRPVGVRSMGDGRRALENAFEREVLLNGASAAAAPDVSIERELGSDGTGAEVGEGPAELAALPEVSLVADGPLTVPLSRWLLAAFDLV